MPAAIHIKPNIDKATGEPFKIRLPDKPHMFLPEQGDVVMKNKFWIRRLRDGSVIETKSAKVGKTAAKIKE
jgi:hypothetical protein